MVSTNNSIERSILTTSVMSGDGYPSGAWSVVLSRTLPRDEVYAIFCNLHYIYICKPSFDAFPVGYQIFGLHEAMASYRSYIASFRDTDTIFITKWVSPLRVFGRLNNLLYVATLFCPVTLTDGQSLRRVVCLLRQKSNWTPPRTCCTDRVSCLSRVAIFMLTGFARCHADSMCLTSATLVYPVIGFEQQRCKCVPRRSDSPCWGLYTG